MAANVNRSANNLNRRIDELLDLARGEMGALKISPSWVDPVRFVSEVANEVGPEATMYGQEVVLDLPETLPRLYADEGRLRQVIQNLINNACKYSYDGGKITLAARPRCR